MKLTSSKFEGVFYRESLRRQHNGRPDRSFSICYNSQGKKRWRTIGWASQGVTAAGAYQTRLNLLQELKTGGVPAGSSELTVAQAVEAWLTSRANAGRATQPDRSRFNCHIGPLLGDVALSKLNQAHLDQLADKIQMLALDTQRNIFTALQAAVSYVIKRKLWAGRSPLSSQAGFVRPPAGPAGERFLTRDEARLLLTELLRTSPVWHDLALLSLSTGLRFTESRRIMGRDVNAEQQLVVVTAKGGQREPVLLTPEALEILQRNAAGPNESVFRNRRGQSFTHTFNTAFSRAVTRLGFNEGVTDSRYRVWFHTLRHTFASWLAQSGVDLYTISKLLRHKSIIMTQRYAHLIPGQQREHLQIIHRTLTAASSSSSSLSPATISATC